MSQFQILGRRPFPFKAVPIRFAYANFPTRSLYRCSRRRNHSRPGRSRGRQARRRPRRSCQEDDPRELGTCGKGGCSVAWPHEFRARGKVETPYHSDLPFAQAVFSSASLERLTPTLTEIPGNPVWHIAQSMWTEMPTAYRAHLCQSTAWVIPSHHAIRYLNRSSPLPPYEFQR